jgi:hypothetical protein
VSDDLADLEASNDERVRALAERQCGLNPSSLNDLRILCYLETLLEAGPGIDAGRLHFQRTLVDQLTAAEAQADQVETMRRQQALMSGGLVPRVTG